MHGGLGRHSTAYGGPVTDGQTRMYFKVRSVLELFDRDILIHSSQIFLPVQIFYLASAVAIKTSLILLYYRLFGVTRWFRWALAFAWLIVVLYFLVCVLVAIFECKPVAYFWDKSIAGGTCINQDQFFRWNGVANLLIDFMILTLTMPLIWHLRLRTRQKLSLTIVFLLCFLYVLHFSPNTSILVNTTSLTENPQNSACVASIVRVITFNDVVLLDWTYTIVNASMWSTIEQSVGIICASLITCQPLVSRVSSFIKNRYSAVDDHPPSNSYELSNVPTGSPMKPSSDGFARLEEAAWIESSATTHVTRAETGKLTDSTEAILKTNTVDQDSDCLRRF